MKSRLSKEELVKSIENIMSVKELPRAASDMRDILPTRHIGIGQGFSFCPAQLNPYLGVIFAKAPNFNNYWIQVLNDALQQRREQ